MMELPLLEPDGADPPGTMPSSRESHMTDQTRDYGERGLLPRRDGTTPEHMLEVMIDYYERKWNVNADVLKTLRNWREWPVVVRMPDLGVDYTIVIEEGQVTNVSLGTPPKARLLIVMLSQTMLRVYYEETTAAIESIAGRVKIKGNETERRRMLAAISHLTW
jgi:hypothetical protein